MEYVSYLFTFKRVICRRHLSLTLHTQSVSGGIWGMILTMEKATTNLTASLSTTSLTCNSLDLIRATAGRSPQLTAWAMPRLSLVCRQLIAWPMPRLPLVCRQLIAWPMPRLSLVCRQLTAWAMPRLSLVCRQLIAWPMPRLSPVCRQLTARPKPWLSPAYHLYWCPFYTYVKFSLSIWKNEFK